MQQQRLDEAYAFCEAVCRNASTTFYSSFSALNIDKRRAVHAVYALCRWVDDIVDGDEEPTILETKELREATEATATHRERAPRRRIPIALTRRAPTQDDGSR